MRSDDEFQIVNLPEKMDRWSPEDDANPDHGWPVEACWVEDAVDPPVELGERVRRMARQRGSDLIALGAMDERSFGPGALTLGDNRASAIATRPVVQHYCYAAFAQTGVDWLKRDLARFAEFPGSPELVSVARRALERINFLEGELKKRGQR
jgi:hypothetical protein